MIRIQDWELYAVHPVRRKLPGGRLDRVLPEPFPRQPRGSPRRGAEARDDLSRTLRAPARARPTAASATSGVTPSAASSAEIASSP